MNPRAREPRAPLARRAESADERLRARDLLADALQALGTAGRLADLLARLGPLLATFLDAEQAAVWVCANDGELRGFASGAPSGEVRVPGGRGLTGAALLSRLALTSADPQFDPRFDPQVDQPLGGAARTLLCQPLLSGDVVVAVVVAVNKRSGAFGQVDEHCLGAVATPLAALIDRARRLDELEHAHADHTEILDGLGSAVLKLGTDGCVGYANAMARRLFRRGLEALVGRAAADVLGEGNLWLMELAVAADETGQARSAVGRDLYLAPGGPPPQGQPERRRRTASVNVQVVPLQGLAGARDGCLLVVEDVTHEKRLRGALARYMDSEVAERLLEEGEGGALGGRLQKATVMFADIRGFTRLTARLGPRETVMLLNDAFTLMVDSVLERHGTLDKYIGDGLMAVFGAPYSMGEDAENALGAALQMLRNLRDFNLRRLADGVERLRVGFGVNTDEVLSGNIGSPRRMDYTVIGDGVNLAARLEGANREYGTDLLISEFTLADLKQPYLLREIDRLRVRGREQPVAAFEVLDYAPEELWPHLRYLVALYNEGLDRYRRRDWEAARRMFEEALRQRPDDGPAKVYSERCAYFEQHPPAADWDGVWDLKDK